MAGNPLCDLVYDCVWPNSIPKKNTPKEEALYKGTLLCCANGNFRQEDT